MKIGSFYGIPASSALLGEMSSGLIEEGLNLISADRNVYSDFELEILNLKNFFSNLSLRVEPSKEEIFYEKEEVVILDYSKLENAFSDEFRRRLQRIEELVKSDGYNGYKSSRFSFSKLMKPKKIVNMFLNAYPFIKDKKVKDKLEGRESILYEVLSDLIPQLSEGRPLNDIIESYVDEWIDSGFVSYSEHLKEIMYGTLNHSDAFTDLHYQDDLVNDVTNLICSVKKPIKWLNEVESTIEKNSVVSSKDILGVPVSLINDTRERLLSAKLRNLIKLGESNVGEECNRLFNLFNESVSEDNSWSSKNLPELINQYQDVKGDILDYIQCKDPKDSLIQNCGGCKEAILLCNDLLRYYIQGSTTQILQAKKEKFVCKSNLKDMNTLAIKIGFGILYIDTLSAVKRHSTISIDNLSTTKNNTSKVSSDFVEFLYLVKAIGDSYMEIGGEL